MQVPVVVQREVGRQAGDGLGRVILPGLGQDVRLRGPGVIGSGLELDRERIQLSAFTSDGGADRAAGEGLARQGSEQRPCSAVSNGLQCSEHRPCSAVSTGPKAPVVCA